MRHIMNLAAAGPPLVHYEAGAALPGLCVGLPEEAPAVHLHVTGDGKDPFEFTVTLPRAKVAAAAGAVIDGMKACAAAFAAGAIKVEAAPDVIPPKPRKPRSDKGKSRKT